MLQEFHRRFVKKRDGIHGIQEGEDTSSTRRLATVRSVNTLARPIQEDRATSSTDMAEQVSDHKEVGKTSQAFVVVEQGQLLRAAETDQCALKVKASQFLKHPHSKRERCSSSHTYCPVPGIQHVCTGGSLTICGDDWILNWSVVNTYVQM